MKGWTQGREEGCFFLLDCSPVIFASIIFGIGLQGGNDSPLVVLGNVQLERKNKSRWDLFRVFGTGARGEMARPPCFLLLLLFLERV